MTVTPWGADLDADHVLSEYPRPQLRRTSHLNLNGYWDYAIVTARAGLGPGAHGLDRVPVPAGWDGRILVPFSPEALLSGVNRQLQPDELLWYRRELNVPAGFDRGRLLLHFGAVDQHCAVLVDGTVLATHEGGYLPFTVDVTGHVHAGSTHELAVVVRDVSDTSYHARGKQRLTAGGIWYTAQSGIWQSVWLESVPQRSIIGLRLVPHLHEGELQIEVFGSGEGRGSQERASVQIMADGEEVAGRADVIPGQAVRMPIPDVRPWSPQDPFRYDLTVRLGADEVRSYAGMRSVRVGPDHQGIPRIHLNGSPMFQVGALDQGYWPDGLYTPPADAALVHDITTMKDLGYTMLRQHIKIAPLRWYYHCDRLGMLVWQDFVNGGRSYQPQVVTAPVLTPLRLDDRRYATFGRQDAAGRAEFRRESRATIDLLHNSPAVVAWVPFNEGWGQFDAARTATEVARQDPSRIVDHASGWHDQHAGDLDSRHVYFRPAHLRHRGGTRALVLSEYGGYSLRQAADRQAADRQAADRQAVDQQGATGARSPQQDQSEQHPYQSGAQAEFGYRRYRDPAAFLRAFERLHLGEVLPSVRRGLSASVYTQVSDVEGETNGLLTADRRHIKVPTAPVRALNDMLTRAGSQEAVMSEREITQPVALCRDDGRLNPASVGWTRRPLHDTDGIGRGRYARIRNKRWEYWNVITPTHILALTVSDISYAGVHEVWVFDRHTGEAIGSNAISPLAARTTLPGTLGQGPVRAQSGDLAIAVDELHGGTRLRAITSRVRFDITAARPEGHEAMGVVVPWSERLFQYTVKDVTRPAQGRLWIDGVAHEVPPGSWAVLDHGRGRWPYRMRWNWGAASGIRHGQRIGVQIGAKWTAGTGSTENALVLDGRVHKISEELTWDYDPEDWLAPWRMHGRRADLTFTPFYDKSSAISLGVVSTEGHQCFGHYTGWMTDDDGNRVQVDGLTGWAEDVAQQW